MSLKVGATWRMCGPDHVRVRPAGLILALVFGLAATGVVPAAHAQDMPTVIPNNYVLSDILNKQRVDAAIASRPSPAHPSGTVAGPTPRSTARLVTTYRASPAVSVRVRDQFADWMGRQVGAESGRKIAQAMAQTDPIRNWAQVVADDGLRPGDVADALAGYWILNWGMATGRDADRAQILAVREQVRPIISANPAYARLNEAQRQEISEVFMLNFLMQHAAYTDALGRGDQATARRLGDAAVARFRNEMGLDLRALKLTDRGFVRA